MGTHNQRPAVFPDDVFEVTVESEKMYVPYSVTEDTADEVAAEFGGEVKMLTDQWVASAWDEEEGEAIYGSFETEQEAWTYLLDRVTHQFQVNLFEREAVISTSSLAEGRVITEHLTILDHEPVLDIDSVRVQWAEEDTDPTEVQRLYRMARREVYSMGYSVIDHVSGEGQV